MDLQLLIFSLMSAGQLVALYLAIRVWRFARAYSKLWGRAWAFFVGMQIAIILRRIAIAINIAGVDGEFIKYVTAADHIVIPLLITACTLIFLITNKTWWDEVFNKYLKGFGIAVEVMKDREAVVGKREDVAKDRESVVTRREDEVRKGEFDLGEASKVEAVQPEDVEVEKPTKLIVGFNEQKIRVEKPEKVSVTKPKKLRIKNVKK